MRLAKKIIRLLLRRRLSDILFNDESNIYKEYQEYGEKLKQSKKCREKDFNSHLYSDVFLLEFMWQDYNYMKILQDTIINKPTN